MLPAFAGNLWGIVAATGCKHKNLAFVEGDIALPCQSVQTCCDVVTIVVRCDRYNPAKHTICCAGETPVSLLNRSYILRFRNEPGW
jgi:hypothetical protein